MDLLSLTRRESPNTCRPRYRIANDSSTNEARTAASSAHRESTRYRDHGRRYEKPALKSLPLPRGGGHKRRQAWETIGSFARSASSIGCDGRVQVHVGPGRVASSALGKLRDICGNCPGLASLALPCGGRPAAILYIHLGRLRIRRGDGKDVF